VGGILVPLGWSNGIATGGGGADRTAASRIVERTNAIRGRHSLPPLTVDPQLVHVGESYARTLGIRPWFAHVGPDGSTVESRSQAYGYHNWEILGENLAMGAGALDPDSIVEAWMRSRHRACSL
jgi:uncharacterized protein YkwD